MSLKITGLNNYEGLTNLQDHIQDMEGLLEHVTQDIVVTCKVLPITFHGFVRVWYHT
jgi:hypothetical protein